jgi:hypothetical protein
METLMPKPRAPSAKDPAEVVKIVAGLETSTTDIGPPPSGAVWGRDLIPLLAAAAAVPFVPITLGRDELVRIRVGGIVTIIAGSGAGKTSITACAVVEHARERGPAIVASLELPIEELAARIVGQSAGRSWEEALTGEVESLAVCGALDLPRLAILDRDIASLATLERAIGEARARFSDEPILVAVDYIQIVESEEREIRARVGDTMRRLSKIARTGRVVMLALSQTSRASGRALGAGESLGAETMTSAAEASDIERWSSITLALGSKSSPAEDGSVIVDLSIGKDRMHGGDRVLPARYDGRTGVWRIAGEAKPAMEVRAERAASKDRGEVDAAKDGIRGFVARSTEPVTREDLRGAAKRKKSITDAAVEELLDVGELVEVRSRKSRAKHWKIWTPAKAAEAGIAVVSDNTEPGLS